MDSFLYTWDDSTDSFSVVVVVVLLEAVSSLLGERNYFESSVTDSIKMPSNLVFVGEKIRRYLYNTSIRIYYISLDGGKSAFLACWHWKLSSEH